MPRDGEAHGLAIEFRQSNHEGEIVDWIQEAMRKKAAGVVINPAGYTTTSVAILDAIYRVKLPTDRSAYHQHSCARGIPPSLLHLEGREGGDLRLRHRRLCGWRSKGLAALIECKEHKR